MWWEAGKDGLGCRGVELVMAVQNREQRWVIFGEKVSLWHGSIAESRNLYLITLIMLEYQNWIKLKWKLRQ